MLHQVRLQDIADIIIITLLAYQLFRWFRHTRAIQLATGIALIAVFYFASKTVGLFMTSWILQQLGTVLFVLIIVVFQTEIRQALYRVSLLRHAFGKSEQGERKSFAELADIIFNLAAERTGALIVLKRDDDLSDYISNGVKIDWIVTPELVSTIFYEGSPLHDGAAVIEDDRIIFAACHLPLAVQSNLPVNCGTRHRAALGLSERSDAIVIVVSEERGTVSVASNDDLSEVSSPEKLTDIISSYMNPAPVTVKKHSLIYDFLFSDIKVKSVVFALVVFCWLILTVKQGEIVTVNAPIRFRNVPRELMLVKSSPDQLEVQLKIFSSLIPSPKQLDVSAEVDLSSVRKGQNSLPISGSNFSLPLGVVFSQSTPQAVKVTADSRVIRKVPVKLIYSGKGKLSLSPERVEIEGPASAMEGIDHLSVSASKSDFRDSDSTEKSLIPPSPLIRIKGDTTVTVRKRK